MLIVTHAETTPVAQAAELQEDLRRAGVDPRLGDQRRLAASGTATRCSPGALPLKHRTCVASAAISPHACGWCRGAGRQATSGTLSFLIASSPVNEVAIVLLDLDAPQGK